jgi:hypothetical protein
MPSVQNHVMTQLYGRSVWEGFTPVLSAPDLQGWNGDHPSLDRLTSSATGEKIVADIGTWKGQSTINMALAMKRLGIDGCVIGVDTFLGSPEHWGLEPPLFSRKHGMPDLFLTFMSNVYLLGVSDYIVPLPQTSVTAAAILRKTGIKPSIAHIDAAHEYEEVLRDAEEYFSILSPAGYLIGDDYHISWPGVVRAANEFAAKHVLPMSVEPPKWIVQKPGS